MMPFINNQGTETCQEKSLAHTPDWTSFSRTLFSIILTQITMGSSLKMNLLKNLSLKWTRTVCCWKPPVLFVILKHAYVHFYLNRCPLLSLCYTCLLTHVYGLSNGSQLFLRNYSLGDSEVSRHEFDHFYTQVLILVYIRWLYLHLQHKGQYYFNFYYHYIVFLQLLHHINQHHGWYICKS